MMLLHRLGAGLERQSMISLLLWLALSAACTSYNFVATVVSPASHGVGDEY